MTAPSQPQPLRVYRVFGLLLVTALVLTSAGYVFFRVTPQERNVNVAGIIIPVPDGMKKVSETSVAADAPDQTHGKVAFKGKVSPSMIVRFYHNLMPAKDWQPDSDIGRRNRRLRVYARQSKINYQRRRARARHVHPDHRGEFGRAANYDRIDTSDAQILRGKCFEKLEGSIVHLLDQALYSAQQRSFQVTIQ